MPQGNCEAVRVQAAAAPFLLFLCEGKANLHCKRLPKAGRQDTPAGDQMG